MTVEVENVRTALMEISVDRIPDSVITQRLAVATNIINAKKKSGATSTNIDQAIIDYCAYDCFRRYVAQYRNDVSSVSDPDGFPMQIDGNDTNRLLNNMSNVLQSLKDAAIESSSLVLGESLFKTIYTVTVPIAGFGRDTSYIDYLNGFS